GVDYTHPDLGGCFGTNQGPTIVTCENSPCIASKERIGSRDNIQGTPEPNAPNTVDGCQDGTLGSYLTDESVESITITNSNNNKFNKNDIVEVKITTYCSSRNDILKLVYKNSAADWKIINSRNCAGGGIEEFTFNLQLDNADGDHAIRAAFDRMESPNPACPGSVYADNDDVVIKIGSSSKSASSRTAGLAEDKCKTFDELFGTTQSDVFGLTDNIISATKNNRICSESRQAFNDQLENLVKKRKELIAELIKTDPDRALAVRDLPDNIKSQFSNTGLIEKRGQFSGRLDVLHVDDFEHPENSKFVFYLNSNGQRYEMSSGKDLPVLISGTQVKVEGLAFEDRMAISTPRQGEPFEVLFVPEDPRNENQGPQKALVILANIGNLTAQATVGQAGQLVFGNNFGSVNDYYIKNSYEKMSLYGDVVGPYNLSSSTCDYWAIMNNALNAAFYDNVNVSNYTTAIIVTRFTSCTFYCGVAFIGKIGFTLPDGTSVRLRISHNPCFSAGVVEHELGHNFGGHHANSYYCLSNGLNVPYSSNCQSYEYGDPYDVLGSLSGHLNAPHKEEMGWLTNDNIITATSGTYILKPLEVLQLSGVVQQIKMPIEDEPNFYQNDNNVHYSIEFRQPFDYDATLPANVHNGVLIHIAKSPINYFTFKQTNILSMNPNSYNYALQVGQTFTDDINGYSITLNSITPEGAQVTVQQIPRNTFIRIIPALISPSSQVQRSNLIFNWNSIEGAASYHIELKEVSSGTIRNFENIIINQFIPATVLPAGTYQWRLRAFNIAGQSTQWSQPLQFHLIQDRTNATSCKVIDGYDFLNDDDDPMDDHGHGTHVAATAAGNGVLKGVAPDASIVAYKVCGGFGCPEDDIIAAIERSVDPNQDGNFSDHLDVISLSLGAYCGIYSQECGPDDPMSQAIDNVVNIGVLAVISAGNSGPYSNTIGSPGTARKAITIGASNKTDMIARFSSRGPVDLGDYALIKPDVVAPGVDICAAEWDDAWSNRRCLDNQHVAISGTSMAAPHVSGAAALIKQAHPDWDADEIKMALRNKAVDLRLEPLTQGYGRLNVLNSVMSTKPPVAFISSLEFNRNSRTIVIRGTARSDNFAFYELSYGIGLNPSQWTSIYISGKPVQEGNLFTWNYGQIAGGEYTLKLEVKDSNGIASIDKIILFIDDPSFYKLADIPSILHKSIAVEDLNNDGVKEIVFVSSLNFSLNRSELHALDYSGNEIPGFPVELINDWGPRVISSPTIADIDKDGHKDIILVSNNYVHALDYQGNYLSGFPYDARNFYREFCSSRQCYPPDNEEARLLVAGRTRNRNLFENSVGDLDNDGYSEIVTMDARAFPFFPQDEFSFDSMNSMIGNLFVIGKDASLLNGFPINLSVGHNSPVALADLNNDNKLEMVVAAQSCIWGLQCPSWFGGRINVIDAEGNSLPGWPITLENYNRIYNAPLIGDLDGDRKNEIVVSTYDWTGFVYSFHTNGTIADGWPVEVVHNPNSYYNYSVIWLDTALGDLNNDEKPEIIVLSTEYNRPIIDNRRITTKTTKLQAYYGNGTQAFQPIEISNLFSNDLPFRPKVGDVNGDNSPEIVFELDSWIYVKDVNGQDVQGWPKYVKDINDITLTDTDGDDKLELLVFSTNGKIMRYSFDTAYNQYYLQWPMFQHDNQHTGLYSDTLIKSKIQNTGTTNIQGYLLMKVQKQTEYGWQDIKTVVNEDRQRIIRAGEFLALDTIWKDSGAYLVNESGALRVYASLRDDNGSVIITTDGNRLEDAYEFKVKSLHCEIIQGFCNGTTIISVSNLSDGFVASSPNFLRYKLCCKSDANSNLRTQLVVDPQLRNFKFPPLFELSSLLRVNVSIVDNPRFVWNMYAFARNDSVQCTMKSNCGEEETCLFSVVGPFNNAHVAHCNRSTNNYDKLCCKITRGRVDMMPPNAMITIQSHTQSQSNVCGNGIIDAGEQCDGTAFGQIDSCTDLGFAGGTLRCNNCRFNTSQCVIWSIIPLNEKIEFPTNIKVYRGNSLEINYQIKNVKDTPLHYRIRFSPISDPDGGPFSIENPNWFSNNDGLVETVQANSTITKSVLLNLLSPHFQSIKNGSYLLTIDIIDDDLPSPNNNYAQKDFFIAIHEFGKMLNLRELLPIQFTPDKRIAFPDSEIHTNHSESQILTIGIVNHRDNDLHYKIVFDPNYGSDNGKGWFQYAKNQIYTLKAGETDIRSIRLEVPQNIERGSYPLEFSILDDDLPPPKNVYSQTSFFVLVDSDNQPSEPRIVNMLSVLTNENSTCRYGSRDSEYQNLPINIPCTDRGKCKNHSIVLENPEIYIRCSDIYGNAMQESVRPITPQSGNCADTDHGRNYYEMGTVTYDLNFEQQYQYSVTDSCSGNTLNEYYCDTNGIAHTTYFLCPNGCIDGACIIQDVCANPETKSASSSGSKSQPNSNAFALMVTPAQYAQKSKLTMHFDDKLGIDTQEISRQIGNVADYDKNKVTFEVNDKNSNPLMITKFGEGNATAASFEGYIVELNNMPIIEKRISMEEEIKELKEEINEIDASGIKAIVNAPIKFFKETKLQNLEKNFDANLREHSSKIEDEHDEFREEVQKLISNSAKSSKISGFATKSREQSEDNIKIDKEFKLTLNGIALNGISEQQAKQIAQLKSVKRVAPNLVVKTNLMESVPLVNAEQLWNEGLTGRRVKIAIIDTGVDYTHPDLGNCDPFIINGNVQNYSLESPHPYENNYERTWTITKPGYTRIAVHFSELLVESGWDYVYILDVNDNIVQTITGHQTNFWSISVNGNTIKIRLTSDEIINDQGFIIDKVIDGSVDFDLNRCSKVIDGYDFVNGDDDPMDDNGHGTHVAATAAGNGVLRGVAPDASIVAYKVLNSFGSGSFRDIIAAIERSVDPNQDGNFRDHLDIISMSLGARCGRGYSDYCGPDDPLSTAVDNAVKAGVTSVIAAGNSGPRQGSIGSPGTARNAITIGASCKPSQIGNNSACDGNVAIFSSRGPVKWSGGVLLKPDVLAPGVDICAAQASSDTIWQRINESRGRDVHCLDDRHIAISGTSMATPHVSGAAALIKQAHPDWKPEDIKSALILNARDFGLNINEQGAGLIDVAQAKEAEVLISPSQINFGIISDKLPASQKLTIKNKKNENIALSLRSDCSLSNLRSEELVIMPNSSADFFYSLTGFPPNEGLLYGNVYISGLNSYKIPYALNQLSNVTISVNSGHQPSFSDIAVFNEDLNFFDYKFEAENSHTVYIPSGSYVVTASGDVVDFGRSEYLLMKKTDVPRNSKISVNLDINDARQFHVKARSLDNTNLVLYEWTKAFRVYNDRLCLLDYYLADPNYGDRTVYVSNKPDVNLDVDVFFKYDGVPSKSRPEEVGGGSSRGFNFRSC
ncbi:S8 family serine peptidase, partial [Candidatus Woesearchaeota archaeon]|nr:S8 family serine peptidase [Candidatus Woesearchaeota archaeon]